MYASLGPGHIGISGTLEEQAEMAKRHGFKGLDLSPGEVADAGGPEEVKALLAEKDLKPGAWSLPFMPYMVNEEEWKSGLDDIKALAETAAAVDAKRAIMWILPSHDELDFDANFAHHVERFKPIAEILAANGVKLGLEFVGPKTARSKKHEFLYDLAGALKLAEAVGNGTGVLLDSFHWYTSGGTLETLQGLKNEQIVHVHVNDGRAGRERDEQLDGERRLPGAEGVIDIKAFIEGLKAANYDGPVTAEPFDQELNSLPQEEKLAKTAASVQAILTG